MPGADGLPGGGLTDTEGAGFSVGIFRPNRLPLAVRLEPGFMTRVPASDAAAPESAMVRVERVADAYRVALPAGAGILVSEADGVLGLDELAEEGRARRTEEGWRLHLPEAARATIAWGDRTIVVPFDHVQVPAMPAPGDRFVLDRGVVAFAVVAGAALAGVGAAAGWAHPLAGIVMNLGLCGAAVWAVYRSQLSTAGFLQNAGVLSALRHPVFDDERALTRRLGAAAYRLAGSAAPTSSEVEWLVARRNDALARFLERGLPGVASFRLVTLTICILLLGVAFGQGCRSVQELTGWFAATGETWAYWVRFGVSWEIETIIFDLPALFGWHVSDVAPRAMGAKLLLAMFNVSVEAIVLGVAWQHLRSWRDARALRRGAPAGTE